MKYEQQASMKNHSFKATLDHPNTIQGQTNRWSLKNLALGGGGESEANLVLGCFFLDDCCLVDIPVQCVLVWMEWEKVVPYEELLFISHECNRYSEILPSRSHLGGLKQ
ncbi:hypothetical protein M9H77_22193 [Catharanthus roseus]|uniref:Uncharacterized protein n=1 Tax=Catharanthus roseus TaxID=4058 RepID=A0ACC0ARI6_CATRO|nr:hypothetical protein M9H77_22193 [Catharanthus roseus]